MPCIPKKKTGSRGIQSIQVSKTTYFAAVPSAGLAGAFLAGAFLAGAFFAPFLAGAFLAAAFLAGAFLAAAFLAGAFFTAAFLHGQQAPLQQQHFLSAFLHSCLAVGVAFLHSCLVEQQPTIKTDMTAARTRLRTIFIFFLLSRLQSARFQVELQDAGPAS